MSIRNHVAQNIYLLAGFHYDQRDLPEMLSSLIHTIRICEHYFKSKSKLSKILTIFNKNHNYFSGGKMKIEPKKVLKAVKVCAITLKIVILKLEQEKYMLPRNTSMI